VTPESVFTAENFDLLAKLEAFATARSHTILDLAIGWLISQPGVSSVLVGASRPEQIGQNTNAADWRLTPEELAEVNEISACSLYLKPVPKFV
jgi:aryl-alcohol dehydrogenase-like predicted oxidoreductase